MDNFQLCWFLLLHLFGTQPHLASQTYQKKIIHSMPKKLNVCLDVAKNAQKLGIDPILAVSIAYHETRLSYAKSSKGAQGPLGVIPKYHCPKNKPVKKCNLVKAGILAIEKFLEINMYELCPALAQYNRGLKGKCKKGRSEYKYAKSVLKTMKKLQHAMYPSLCYDPNQDDGC